MRYVSVLLMFVFLASLVAPLHAQGNTQGNKADDMIYDEVRRKLANDITVKGGGLDVAVKDGVVTLQGQVHDLKARDKAEKITKKVKGVVSVNNQLKVFGTN